MGDAGDVVGAGEGAVLTDDLGRARCCLWFRVDCSILVACSSIGSLRRLRNGAARPIYPGGSAAGSNKFVVNPASGGAQPALRACASDRAHASGGTPARRARAGPCAGWLRAPARARRWTRPRRRRAAPRATPDRHRSAEPARRPSRPARRERETARGRFDARQRRDERAQTADLDAQARAVRLVRAARAERARDQRVAIDVAGPRLGERARQREQHRPARSDRQVAPARTPRRQASITSAPEARSASTSSRRSDCSSPARMRRAAGRSSAARASATSASSAGTRARRRHRGRARVLHAPAPCSSSAARPRPRELGHASSDGGMPRASSAANARAASPIRPSSSSGAPRSGARAARWRDRRAPRASQTRSPACAASREVAHRERHLGVGDDAARPRELLVRAEARAAR